MKEDYGFFNSKDHDRVYNAKDWADYFFPFFRTGVFNGHLQIVENEGMSIKAKPGYAWIDGYKYHLWDDSVLDLEMASGNMNRKDSIVLRLDLTNKWIRMFCKTGSYYAGTATPPAPEISATVHEIVIAHISVAAGTTRITQSMIEDTRMNKEICGWVCGTVEQIDFSQITAQFEGFFADYRKNISDEFKQFQENADKYNEQFVAWAQDFVNKWESWLLGETKGWQEEIIDWFNNLREQLTENAAVSLQMQIGNMNNLETENKDDLVSAINSLALTYDETMDILREIEIITVSLSAYDGSSVIGQSVILHNNTTGMEESKTYEGAPITFKVSEEESYYITASGMTSYATPESEIFTAVKRNKRTVILEYLEDVEVVTVTLTSEDGQSVDGQSVILHNDTTGTDTSTEYTDGGVTFKVPSGQSYYVTATDNGDYVTPKSENYIAVIGNKRAVTLTYEIAKDLCNMTWEKIAACAESGKAAQVFKIGDTKDFTLTTGEKCKAVILDFNHDTLTSNTEKTAGITFGLFNCLETKYLMNSSDTNAGGYDGSLMFTTITTEFYDKLPADMKPYIKKVRKKASAGKQSSTIKSFDVFAFLFAEIEVLNTTDQSFPGEGTFYPYFATEANRIKKLGESGIIWFWFLRSPRNTSNEMFGLVRTDGSMHNAYAASPYGLLAGFCM